MVIDLSKPVRAYFTDDDLDDFELFYEAAVEISKNIEFTAYNSCQLLLERLQQQSPDIIFLDMNLGSMSGIECLQIIKTIPGLNLVPKVIISTSVSKSRVEECFKSGANYFLQKPGSYEKIIEEMRKIFEKEW